MKPRQNAVLGASRASEPSVGAPSIGSAIAPWFLDSARDLPWRRERTGYRALVSEAMLQQTQVDRVVPAFERFMKRFPTVQALAGASEEDVVAAWQGLGYYRRARMLHAAAHMIVAEFGGEVPACAEALRSLPGVGRYTAGAISSIVFGASEPIVDGNIARVFARLAMHPGTPGEPGFDAWCWSQAEEVVASTPDPGIVNEGLMELGATVCTRHEPRCEDCPLRDACLARAEGDPAAIPPPRRAAARKCIHHHSVLITRIGPDSKLEETLLVRRGARGLWSGMWEPPTCESTEILEPGEVSRGLPATVSGLCRVACFEHRTTHRDVVFHVHVADSGEPLPEVEFRWQPLQELDQVGMSNAHLRMLRGEYESS